MREKEFDYIVVGAGTAGCVVANRLSADNDVSVLLLEAGPPDTNKNIHRPAGLFKLFNGNLTWNYKTVPQRQLNGREVPFFQGRVLGGGSSVNGQVFTRGSPDDYDIWADKFGGIGWFYSDLLPYFRRFERNDTLGGEFHGTDGPQGISTMSPDPLTRAFIQACQQFGIPYTPDFNGPSQEGTGAYQTFTWNGRRCSTASGYLRPATGRANLAVRTGCLVNRILIENCRAVGLEISSARGIEEMRASREIIVTAGAIGSPKLLMLSGLGPTEHLRDIGIDPVADLPGVGQNLQDHLDIDVVLSVNPGLGFDKYKSPHMMLWAALQYFFFGTGPVASSIVEGGAFWSVDRSTTAVDTQLHFEPATGTEPGSPVSPTGAGCMFNGYFVRPESRGSVRLASVDPATPPLIDPNYLAEPRDLEMTVKVVRLMREIARQPALVKFGAHEFFPGSLARTDEEISDFIRGQGRTAYHAVGTCRMGNDEGAVVDPSLRVRGIEALRVCDSSVMPRLVSANTNATAIMIGEKASDLICAERS